MTVYQSYLSAIIKGRYSLYECRLFLQIVKAAQPLFSGKRMAHLMQSQVCVDGLNLNLSVQISTILSDGSKHYEDVKEAARSLEAKIVEHYDPVAKIWRSAPLIYNVQMVDNSGVITFSAAKWLMSYIVDLCKGYTSYDIASALSLKSSYSTRLYMIFCSLSQPIVFKIQFFRELFGLSDKYAQPRDFIKRVIDPALAELESEALNSFRYEVIKAGRKIDALKLIPVKRQQKSKSELAAMAGLSAFCDPVLRSILSTRCDFSARELGAHKELLMRFGKVPCWQDHLSLIIERQRRKRASKGYIIASMRSVVTEAKNVISK